MQISIRSRKNVIRKIFRILPIFVVLGGGMYYLLSEKIKGNTQKEAEKISRHYTAIAYLAIGRNYRSQYDKMQKLEKFDDDEHNDEHNADVEIRKTFLDESIKAFYQGMGFCSEYDERKISLTRFELMHN